MRKIIIVLLTTLYVLISVIVTTCLLHYNDYNVTVFNNNSLVCLKKNYDELKKWSLVIVANKDIVVGDKVFYYETINNNVNININLVKKIDKINDNETMYTFDDNKVITKDLIIGTKNDSKVYPFIGGILIFIVFILNGPTF